MKRILIVEDDTTLREGICLAIQSAEITILQANDILQGRELLRQHDFDLVLLDINLPDGSGLTLLREIKDVNHTPVILLTANDTEMDVVTGLEHGADDYITKPFSLAILRARINSQLRRGDANALPAIAIDGYIFDFDKMQFTHNETPVELSKTEQKLLRLLVENRGATVSRELLLDRVWDSGAEFVDENTLSVAIKRLRDKLDAAVYIKTEYGLGYCWVVK